MNYLSVEQVSKSFGERALFEQITFGIAQGEKAALVAKNGSGKSTLLRILKQLESPDSGQASFRKDVKVGYLDQDPQYPAQLSVWQAIFGTDHPIIQTIREYQDSLLHPEDAERMEKALAQMDIQNAWDYEVKIKEILTRFHIEDWEQKVGTLSGGQRKRLALAQLLIEEPDFLILDEPTNHLDLDLIEWLEEFLGQSQRTLLMVTHDRYFLERVCNLILELTPEAMYRYPGNYSYFLEKQAERKAQHGSEVHKARSLMKTELEWIRRQPKARGTKAKARIDAFAELKKTASQNVKEDSLQLGVNMSRMGKKILELKGIQKAYGEKVLVQDFEYIFKRGEKVGIVGPNGVGKTTFLNILTGTEKPDAGTRVTGETVIFGYYTQKGIALPEDKRVIEVVQDIAEFIPLSNGQQLSASQLLNRFLFPPDDQYKYVSTLSGGERRRLYLLTILAQNPNFLILDEPTNDLDIVSLQVLEDFLSAFGGCLLVVSHDRYFLDKLVNHLFIFEGKGLIRDFNGFYSEYRAHEALKKEEETNRQSQEKKKVNPPKSKPAKEKTKLSYMEQKEYDALEEEIEALETQKSQLEQEMNQAGLSPDALMEKSQEYQKVNETLEQKTDRWLELSEYVD